MSVLFVADKQPQPEPERIQATPSQSPRDQTTEHYVIPWLKLARRIGIAALMVLLSMTTPFTAAVSANPGSEGFYILWAFNEGNVASTSVLAHVRIEYEVRFTRPVQVAVS